MVYYVYLSGAPIQAQAGKHLLKLVGFGIITTKLQCCSWLFDRPSFASQHWQSKFRSSGGCFDLSISDKTMADISSPPRSSLSPPSGHVDEKDEILRNFRLLPCYMTLSCSNIFFLIYHTTSANVQDLGFCNDTTKPSVYSTVDNTIILDTHKQTALVSETISEMATRSIFGWLRSYGWPAAEKAIYSHSWFISEGSDDETGDDPEDEVSDPGKVKYTSDKFERITAWLDQCAKESEGALTFIQNQLRVERLSLCA
ncbi:hypothetical protein B7494_g221 [Chlorociboria aeruginascens]|nr:hypothetical protein B7494_g221 [Chlorociboria aeruginascens]